MFWRILWAFERGHSIAAQSCGRVWLLSTRPQLWAQSRRVSSYDDRAADGVTFELELIGFAIEPAIDMSARKSRTVTRAQHKLAPRRVEHEGRLATGKGVTWARMLSDADADAAASDG